jgi:hypothetical protein
MKKLQIAIMAAALVTAIQAHASLFDITFTGVDGVTFGSGEIIATDNGGGVYTADSGTFVIAPGGPLIAGTYSLIPNPGAPNQSTSPSGLFFYDNQVAAQADPFLSNNGLLFGNGPVDVNLYSNLPLGSTPEYNLVEGLGGDYIPNINGINGSATLTPVPEVSTMIAGALLLLPFGASTLRILRRNRMV